MTGITRSSSLRSEACRRRVIRPIQLRTRILGFVATVIACHLGALVPHGMAEPRMAQRGDISLSVTLLTKDGTLSAYGPLLARIEWLNQSKDAIHFDLGNGVEPDTYLEIRDHKGSRVTATPRPLPSLGGMQGGCHLAPGELHTGIRGLVER